VPGWLGWLGWLEQQQVSYTQHVAATRYCCAPVTGCEISVRSPCAGHLLLLVCSVGSISACVVGWLGWDGPGARCSAEACLQFPARGRGALGWDNCMVGEAACFIHSACSCTSAVAGCKKQNMSPHAPVAPGVTAAAGVPLHCLWAAGDSARLSCCPVRGTSCAAAAR
jgi:hypothetical protein